MLLFRESALFPSSEYASTVKILVGPEAMLFSSSVSKLFPIPSTNTAAFLF